MHSIINPSLHLQLKISSFLNLVAVRIAGHVLSHVSRISENFFHYDVLSLV